MYVHINFHHIFFSLFHNHFAHTKTELQTNKLLPIILHCTEENKLSNRNNCFQNVKSSKYTWCISIWTSAQNLILVYSVLLKQRKVTRWTKSQNQQACKQKNQNSNANPKVGQQICKRRWKKRKYKTAQTRPWIEWNENHVCIHYITHRTWQCCKNEAWRDEPLRGHIDFFMSLISKTKHLLFHRQ